MEWINKIHQGNVLDPFSGMGTTCRRAKELDRQYIGIELSEKYAKRSEELLSMTDYQHHLEDNMAHDRQCKDEDSPVYVNGALVKRFACPKKGEHFYNRDAHRIEEADRDMDDKYLIVERGN